ncbi:MAG: class I SAM-dependent methyltransferase [Actinomycetota bacterium]|nr:class I SAM-dependent methyltransferase [Actinomycetota bacterium]
MDLKERVGARSWYHTIELAPGVTTPGWFDLRPFMHAYGLPERLDGKRALDVGTWDGFWAFEMEKRGAEVVALDLDDERDLDYPPRRRPKEFPEEPRGQGFRIAKEALGSDVERVSLSIYDATPEELGSFDLVFCGSVLIHLRDQLLALERIAGLCSGTFISAEEYDRLSGLVPFPVSRYLADRDKAVVFWLPSVRTWRRMLWTAGFDRIESRGKFKLKSTEGFDVPHVVHHAHKDGGGG